MPSGILAFRPSAATRTIHLRSPLLCSSKSNGSSVKMSPASLFAASSMALPWPGWYSRLIADSERPPRGHHDRVPLGAQHLALLGGERDVLTALAPGKLLEDGEIALLTL